MSNPGAGAGLFSIGEFSRVTGLTIKTLRFYTKGPGMIFKGNPRNYLTEIQIPIGDGKAQPTEA